MHWNDGLPDADSWSPQLDQAETLRNALMVSCQIAQARIVARSDAETRFNRHSFDAGLSVEDIVRDEMRVLLPSRYAISLAVISDRRGATAGEQDIVIRNEAWAPVIKPRATAESRRIHVSAESVYAVAEVKRTLDFSRLDEAMEQLVRASRLERPISPYGHITENQHLESLDQAGKLLNPLHTTVFATQLRDGLAFEDLARRFGAINAKLSRDHMVKMLCVLGTGTAWYSVESGEPYSATYMWDRQTPLILQINQEEPRNSFYRFVVELLAHLSRSVLGLTGIANIYGTPPPPRAVGQYPDAAFNQ
ncbi:MAG: hypothetical protein F4169_07960 [Gammaproteobacteria bacterium]|nr:hypothetical protein [Chloroflexota bacterium]MYF28787.1 hypothetical protein [Gammaproteobacteria bacterium]